MKTNPQAGAFSVYLAAEGRERELRDELGHGAVPLVSGAERLWRVEGPPRPVAWAQDIWLAPQIRSISSIKDAADQLRAIQRNWCLVPGAAIRRSRLIEARLPPLRRREWRFGDPVPTAPMGAFTLLDPSTLVFSPRNLSPFPAGEVVFEEDRDGPPSRAYLKLWEALAILGDAPTSGQRCIDMGSSPGGWTWSLAQLGVDVVSVDKAPLEPRVQTLPNVAFRQESAFGLEPEPFDWFFSDVICYPARLLRMIERWLPSVPRFICTIKLQGKGDEEAVAALAALPNARVRHLFHNRHELTVFIHPDIDALRVSLPRE